MVTILITLSGAEVEARTATTSDRRNAPAIDNALLGAIQPETPSLLTGINSPTLSGRTGARPGWDLRLVVWFP